MPRQKNKKAIAVKPDFNTWKSYGIVKEEKATKKTKEQK